MFVWILFVFFSDLLLFLFAGRTIRGFVFIRTCVTRNYRDLFTRRVFIHMTLAISSSMTIKRNIRIAIGANGTRWRGRSNNGSTRNMSNITARSSLFYDKLYVNNFDLPIFFFGRDGRKTMFFRIFQCSSLNRRISRFTFFFTENFAFGMFVWWFFCVRTSFLLFLSYVIYEWVSLAFFHTLSGLLQVTSKLRPIVSTVSSISCSYASFVYVVMHYELNDRSVVSHVEQGSSFSSDDHSKITS